MRATSLFSLRRALLPRTLPGILLMLLIGAWGFRWIQNVANPQDLNHLLILDMSNREYGLPLTVSLDGEFGWTESFGGEASKCTVAPMQNQHVRSIDFRKDLSHLKQWTEPAICDSW